MQQEATWTIQIVSDGVSARCADSDVSEMLQDHDPWEARENPGEAVDAIVMLDVNYNSEHLKISLGILDATKFLMPEEIKRIERILARRAVNESL